MQPAAITKLTMDRNSTANIEYGFMIEEIEIDLLGRRSRFNVAMVARLINGASAQKIGWQYAEFTLNGQKLTVGSDDRYVNRTYHSTISSTSWQAFTAKTIWLPHESEGDLTIGASARFLGDLSGVWPISYFAIDGSASMQYNATFIDLSAPVITTADVIAGDYGRTLQLQYHAQHSSYAITCELLLSGFTAVQRDVRRSALAAALPGATVTAVDTDKIRIKTSPGTQTASFGVTISTGSDAELENGGVYGYELTITAENGKIAGRSGTYRVPCRVETFAVQPQELFIKRNESETVELIFTPSDADVKTASAQVDAGIWPYASPVIVDGYATGEIVAGNSDGICSITFTSTDGQKTAQVIVTVGETPTYPRLGQQINNLTPYWINRMQAAASFIADELRDLGLTVDALDTVITTYAEPVTGIRAKLNALVDNCYKIKAATTGTAYAVALTAGLTYPATNAKMKWHTTTNKLVAFLDATQDKIEA